MVPLSGCAGAVDTFTCPIDAFHLLLVSEKTVPERAKENIDGEGDASCVEDRGESPRVTLNEFGRPRTSRPREREQGAERGEGDRRRRHPPGAAEGNMAAKVDDERDRSSSLELTTEWGLGETSGGSESPRGRLPREGARGNGHARPTPSYALPTKHFKTLDRYCAC